MKDRIQFLLALGSTLTIASFGCVSGFYLEMVGSQSLVGMALSLLFGSFLIIMTVRIYLDANRRVAEVEQAELQKKLDDN